jgi:hypothetical protein
LFISNDCLRVAKLLLVGPRGGTRSDKQLIPAAAAGEDDIMIPLSMIYRRLPAFSKVRYTCSGPSSRQPVLPSAFVSRKIGRQVVARTSLLEET